MELLRDLVRDLVGIIFPGAFFILLMIWFLWATMLLFGSTELLTTFLRGNTFYTSSVLLIFAYIAAWYKITNAGVGTEAGTRIYRAGSKHLPLVRALVMSGPVGGTRLVIYDLTKLGCPMWMEFVAAGASMIRFIGAGQKDVAIGRDRDVPEGVAAGLDMKTWSVGEVLPPQWIDAFDKQVFRNIGGTLDWFAIYGWMGNLICKKPNANWIMRGITGA